MYSSDFSREDLVNRLRYLKPNKGFRSAYQYNNLTVMTMGYLEGKLTGLGWEGSIREEIFAPLGMSHSDLSVTDMEKTDDYALPYELKKDVVSKVPFHNIDAIGPAGAINSSVDDMSHCLIFQGASSQRQEAGRGSQEEQTHRPQDRHASLAPPCGLRRRVPKSGLRDPEGCAPGRRWSS